ncbi:MAG: HAD-IIA family hydrolase [Lachnospiraceae bacterium]|nr:HAD-IIA family hydrolase [Lachnospiraceae bacterium]
MKKLFLFDIDGTIAVGDTLYEGSAELLSYIERIGGKAYYITNNSTKSATDYVKKFRECYHLETTNEQFVTSGYLTLRFLLRNYADRTIYCMGTQSFIDELRRHGLTVTEKCQPDIDCVVVAYDSELSYEKLCETSKVLLTMDVPYYATNPDLRCPAPFGFIPDCGAMCDLLEATTDKHPTYLGKPSKKVVDLCLSLSGYTPEETLVVGDRLYTDIACGINAGVDTCVLFTGEAKKSDLKDTPYKPTYEFETAKDLWQACEEGRI